MHETELHDLSDDADYASAASQLQAIHPPPPLPPPSVFRFLVGRRPIAALIRRRDRRALPIGTDRRWSFEWFSVCLRFPRDRWAWSGATAPRRARPPSRRARRWSMRRTTCRFTRRSWPPRGSAGGWSWLSKGRLFCWWARSIGLACRVDRREWSFFSCGRLIPCFFFLKSVRCRPGYPTKVRTRTLGCLRKVLYNFLFLGLRDLIMRGDVASETVSLSMVCADRNLYTIKGISFSDIRSIRRHNPTLGWQYIIVVMSSGKEPCNYAVSALNFLSADRLM